MPPLEPRKQGRIALAKGASVRRFATLALRDCALQVEDNARGVLASDDPRFVHQMRVGIRRTRVALALFRRLLPARRVAAIERELKRAFRELGALRELDVLLLDLRRFGDELASTANPAVIEGTIDAERSQRRKRARKLLKGSRFTHACAELQAFHKRLEESAKGSERVEAFLTRKLERRMRRVEAMSDVLERGDADALHTLRKRLKALRYTLELGRAAFAGKRVRPFLSEVTAVLELLGSINDAQVARERLPELLADASQVPLREHLLVLIAREAESKRRELAPALGRLFAAKPFFRA
jgi:CHAD domain-containing protein